MAAAGMVELPKHVRAFSKTGVFSQTSVPAGLLRDHATKEGVWGLIEVISGELNYVVPDRGLDVVLRPGAPGVIEPAVKHRVEPLGEVEFAIEFWR